MRSRWFVVFMIGNFNVAVAISRPAIAPVSGMPVQSAD
jgi:hypothetical protein